MAPPPPSPASPLAAAQQGSAPWWHPSSQPPPPMGIRVRAWQLIVPDGTQRSGQVSGGNRGTNACHFMLNTAYRRRRRRGGGRSRRSSVLHLNNERRGPGFRETSIWLKGHGCCVRSPSWTESRIGLSQSRAEWGKTSVRIPECVHKRLCGLECVVLEGSRRGGRCVVFINSGGIYKPSQVSSPCFAVWMGSSEYGIDAISQVFLRSGPSSRQPPCADAAKDSGKAHRFHGTFWIILKFSDWPCLLLFKDLVNIFAQKCI